MQRPPRAPATLHSSTPTPCGCPLPFTSGAVHYRRTHRLRTEPCRAAESAGKYEGVPATPAQSDAAPQPDQSTWGRLKRFVLGGDKKMDMARLRALGFGAFAAYGVISNINAGILVTIAWLTVVKTKGVTPLAPGMWPSFLAVYAGLWVSSHFMRPIRLSLAIAAAPAFDAAMGAIQKRTGWNKAAAFGVILVGIVLFSVSFLLLALTVSGGFPNGSFAAAAPPTTS